LNTQQEPPHREASQLKLRRAESSLESFFCAVVYLLSVLSIVGISLLSLGLFTPLNVTVGAIGTAVFCLRLLRKRLYLGRMRAQEWGLVVILLVAVLVRSNPATFLNGGQDPGVYSAMAIHFARTGTLQLSDTLLPDLSDSLEIRSYYLKRSMHRLAEKRPGVWGGNMLPGVYLADLERNQWDFQFYALHPMWLAIGHWLFGLQAQSWILVIFSTLSVMSVFFITRRITGAYAPALCAAFLLAVNPGHAYFATFPVSETVACFFFLSALYLLLDKRFLGFLAPLMALFLTRITGFITAPLLLASLGWMALRRRDPRPLWAGFGVLGVYVISFYWGLTFSPHYSFDIYRSKLGLGSGAVRHAWMVFVVSVAAWAAFGYLGTRARKQIRGCVRWVSRHRYAVSGCLVALLLGVCAYRGYLLGFTDHYNHHRWYANRWKMAGHGWLSVRFLSLNTLRLLLSSTGLVAFFLGLIAVGAAACRRSILAPVALVAIGFSFAFLVGQLTTPITYYFARYLVSEVVPLACICAAVVLETVRRYVPRWGDLLFPLFGACVLYSVWPALVVRMSAVEGQGVSEVVECLGTVTGPSSVLLIDSPGLAFGAYSYSTPLRLGFGKRVYTVLASDFAAEPGKFDGLIAFFEQKNLEVFLLSSSPRWSDRAQFANVLTLPVRQDRLLAQRRLPTRFKSWSRTVRLYARRPLGQVPAVCGRTRI
jgi:hypothetical protein